MGQDIPKGSLGVTGEQDSLTKVGDTGMTCEPLITRPI